MSLTLFILLMFALLTIEFLRLVLPLLKDLGTSVEYLGILIKQFEQALGSTRLTRSNRSNRSHY